MCSVSKERREELRALYERVFHELGRDTDGAHLIQASLGDLRALLDMADERDRYRALLEAVKKSRFLSYGWKARIEAELEGNDGD